MSPGTKVLVILATLIATAIAAWVTNTAAKKPAGLINYAPPPMYAPDGTLMTPTVETQTRTQAALPVVFLQMWLVVEVPLMLVCALITWGTNY